MNDLRLVLLLFFFCSIAQAQSGSKFIKKREVYIGLGAGRFGYQDSRFFKTTFGGAAANLEIGSRLIKPGSIRGYTFTFRRGLGKSKNADNSIKLLNLGAFRYEYLKRVQGYWYIGGQLDLLDIYMPNVSDLDNTNSLTVNNTLMGKIAYRRPLNRGWTFHSGFALGLLSLHRNGITATYVVPEKALEKGDVGELDSPIASTKHFSLLTLGRLNKISWRSEVYRKRWVFSYTWEMLNYWEAGQPVTISSHALSLRLNIFDKTH